MNVDSYVDGNVLPSIKRLGDRLHIGCMVEKVQYIIMSVDNEQFSSIGESGTVPPKQRPEVN